MRRPPVLLVPLVSLLALLAPVLGAATPSGAQADGTGPKARGVGDSVFRSAQAHVEARLRPEYRPRFESVNAATIADMTPAARRMVANADPVAMVLGVGNPDVAAMRTGFTPYAPAETLLNVTQGVPCVVWINIKERGIIGYNADWEGQASQFNVWLVGATRPGGLQWHNLHILDWNASAARHPGWFLGDGLHLNQTGQTGYANKIDRFVNRACPP